MRLLADIRAFPHRNDPDWLPEVDAPIDYCYVRPSHIPSVNAMCQHSFWPGVCETSDLGVWCWTCTSASSVCVTSDL